MKIRIPAELVKEITGPLPPSPLPRPLPRFLPSLNPSSLLALVWFVPFFSFPLQPSHIPLGNRCVLGKGRLRKALKCG